MLAEKFLDVTQYFIRLLLRLEKPFEKAKLRRERKIAYALAEEMHQKLQKKRRGGLVIVPQTPEEKLAELAWEASLTPREKCTHCKGATATRFGLDKYRGGRVIKDYNVGDHTFNDGSRKIWCLTGCGFVSWEGDEKWAEALKMSEDSTNRPSSSERPVVK